MNHKYHGLALQLDAIGWVIVVLIFMSGVLLSGGYIIESSKISKAKTETASIGAAITQYKYEMGEYPKTLNLLTSVGEGDKSQYGPWLKYIEKDPWNNNYSYSYNETGFVIFSYGSDKKNDGSSVNTGIAENDIGFTGM